MAAVAQPVVGDVKWRRFCAAVLDRNDSEMRQLIKDVDECFGKGGYMVNDFRDYRTEEAFALGEELCLRRLREFLHLVGDIKVPIAWLIIKNKDPEDITMDDCLDTDVLFAVSALESCGLLEDTDSIKEKLSGLIIKIALFYARNENAKIPRSLLQL